jgi:hypothetical protein
LRGKSRRPERRITGRADDDSDDLMPRWKTSVESSIGRAERRPARLRRALHESILLVVLAVAVVGDWTHLSVGSVGSVDYPEWNRLEVPNPTVLDLRRS